MFLLIRLKQRKFNKEEWETNTRFRKYFYKNIIESRMLIDKNIYDCIRLLGTKQRKVAYGDSWRIDDLKEWKYFLHKTPVTGSVYSLGIYFEDGKVNKVKLISEPSESI